MSRPSDPLAKAKILQSARKEFSRVGLVNARIEDITKAAGLSKGAFYLHFKSKNESFYAIIDYFLADMARCAERYYPDIDLAQSFDDLHEVLIHHDTEMLSLLWENRDIVSMFHTSGDLRLRYARVLDTFLDSQANQIAAIIGKLQSRGLYTQNLDPEITAIAIAGAWFNLSRRMACLSSRPDFCLWARNLRNLFSTGMSP